MDNTEYSCSPKEWQRFYLGYRERFVDDCCIPLQSGREVRLRQAPSAKQFKQQGPSQHKQQHRKQQQGSLDKQADPALTGSTVWDGAVVLAQYLSGPQSPLVDYRASRQHSSQAAAPNTSSSCIGDSGSKPLTASPAAVQPAAQKYGSQQQHQPEQHPQQQQEHQQQQLPLLADQQQQQEQQQQPASVGQPQAVGPGHGFTCLELGAGTGAVSLCVLAARAVDWALITDIPDMLPHLQSNVQHNSSVLDTQRALVLPLRWGEAADVDALQRLGQQQLGRQQQQQWDVSRLAGFNGQVSQHAAQELHGPQLQPPFELIVGSDLIYYSYTPSTPHSRLLLQALVQLSGPHSLIYLALSLHHNPEEVHAFMNWAQDWGFDVQTVTDGVPAEYVVPDVLVVQLRMVDQVKAQAAAAAAAAGTLRRQDELHP